MGVLGVEIQVLLLLGDEGSLNHIVPSIMKNHLNIVLGHLEEIQVLLQTLRNYQGAFLRVSSKRNIAGHGAAEDKWVCEERGGEILLGFWTGLLELNLRSSLVMVISRYSQLDVAKAILAQGLDLTYSCYRSFSGKGTVGKGHLHK